MSIHLEEAGLAVQRGYHPAEDPLHRFMSSFSKRQTQERIRLILRHLTAPLSLHHYSVAVWQPIAEQMFDKLPSYSPAMVDVISRVPGEFVPVPEIETAPIGAIVIVGVADRPAPNEPRPQPTRTAVGWLGLPSPAGRPAAAEKAPLSCRPHVWVDGSWKPCRIIP